MLKKLNNKTGCAKVNTSFVSTVPWSKFCQSKLTTVYQRYEATAISIKKGLFKCTLACFYIVTMNYTKKRENSIFHVFLYNLW